jgi:hypothetical protein
MRAAIKRAVAIAAGLAMAPAPLVSTAARADGGGDPNDAIDCVEDLGVRGYSVRINNRCNYPLRLATCVVGSKGNNACEKGGQQEMFPVEANARNHVILDMQVGSGTRYFILACKDPWTPGRPHMANGEYTADECAW